jgi:hypothetical protein
MGNRDGETTVTVSLMNSASSICPSRRVTLAPKAVRPGEGLQGRVPARPCHLIDEGTVRV